MKDRVLKALTDKVGKDRAEKFYALFVAALCGGIEPQEGDTFTKEDIAEAFASNIPARNALTAALCGDAPAAPKSRKFKADKARSYSPADLVSFIFTDPKAEGLRAEYMRRTGGAAALFYVDGKLAEAESADRIQRLFDRDPVAPFVTIGGKDVEPTGYPEDAAKTDCEDPYQSGAPLGQPGDVSVRLGVSLADIGHETRQAIACAVAHDLADASVRELQADAAAAKGQSAIAYLANKPMAYRKWPTWPKSALVLTRETPRNPTAAAEVPGTLRGNIDAPTTNDVCAAVISVGLSREALMAGIDRGYVATLATMPNMASQTMCDVNVLARNGPLRDGSNPWRQYLANAAQLAGPRREAAVFQAALAAVGPTVPAWVNAAPFAWTDRDAQRFVAALASAYDDPADSRRMCRETGILTSHISLSGSPETTWGAICETAANQDKLRALFTTVLADETVRAHFSPWRALAATSQRASAPLLFVLTCGETKWKDMRLQFVPAARAGKIEVVADVDCPPGVDTRRWFSEQVERSAALLVLVSAATMSSDVVTSAVATVRAAGKPAFLVMVRPCLTQYGPFAGKVFLLDGALYSDDNGPGIVSGVMGALRL